MEASDTGHSPDHQWSDPVASSPSTSDDTEVSCDSGMSDGSSSPPPHEDNDSWFGEPYAGDPFPMWPGNNDDNSSTDGFESTDRFESDSWSDSFSYRSHVDDSYSSGEETVGKHCGDLSDELSDDMVDELADLVLPSDQKPYFAEPSATEAAVKIKPLTVQSNPAFEIEFTSAAPPVPLTEHPTTMAVCTTETALWQPDGFTPTVAGSPAARPPAARATQKRRNASPAPARALAARRAASSASSEERWSDGVALKPTLRSRKKTMVVRFKQFSHAYSEAEEIYVYKCSINPLKTYAVSAPMSQLVAPIFCFLGCSWPSTQYSAVPNTVDESCCEWRLNSMTLSSLEYEEGNASPTVQVYFGICGWRPGVAGIAMVSEEGATEKGSCPSVKPSAPHPPLPSSPPYAAGTSASVKQPARGGGPTCAFCPSPLTKNFTKRFRRDCGYTGPDFCGRCAQTMQRHKKSFSRGPQAKPLTIPIACTLENRCTVCTSIMAYYPLKPGAVVDVQRKRKSVADASDPPAKRPATFSAAAAIGAVAIMFVALIALLTQGLKSGSEGQYDRADHAWQWTETASFAAPFDADSGTAVWTVGDAVYMFGGRLTSGRAANEMWVLTADNGFVDLSDRDVGSGGLPSVSNPSQLRIMLPLSRPGQWPCARQNAMVWSTDEALFMFGGLSEFGNLQDLWRYNVGLEVWDLVWTGGNVMGWNTQATAKREEVMFLVDWLTMGHASTNYNSGWPSSDDSWPVARHAGSVARSEAGNATWIFGGILMLPAPVATDPVLNTKPSLNSSSPYCAATQCGRPFVLLNDFWRIDDAKVPSAFTTTDGDPSDMPAGPWTNIRATVNGAGHDSRTNGDLPIYNYANDDPNSQINKNPWPSARAFAAMFVEAAPTQVHPKLSGAPGYSISAVETVWMFGGLGLRPISLAQLANPRHLEEPGPLCDLWSLTTTLVPKATRGLFSDQSDDNIYHDYGQFGQPVWNWLGDSPTKGSGKFGGIGRQWPTPRLQPTMLWLQTMDDGADHPLFFGGVAAGPVVGDAPTHADGLRDLWLLHTPCESDAAGVNHCGSSDPIWARTPWAATGTAVQLRGDDADDTTIIAAVRGHCLLRRVGGETMSSGGAAVSACADDDMWTSMWGNSCVTYAIGGVNEGRCAADSANVYCPVTCGTCPDAEHERGASLQPLFGAAQHVPPLHPREQPRAAFFALTPKPEAVQFSVDCLE